jgi:hypothetical protein
MGEQKQWLNNLLVEREEFKEVFDFFFFGGTRVSTQGFVLAREAFYGLSYASRLFLL